MTCIRKSINFKNNESNIKYIHHVADAMKSFDDDKCGIQYEL